MPKGKGNKPLLDQSVKDQATLKVLKNDDPEVEDVLGSASHVTLYGFDLDAQAWSRKNVEGTLFVVKRRVEPRFQFVVLNRLSSENCREDLLGAFEFELSPPYLLYRSPTEVNGIWFYRQEECDEISALFDKITGAFGADAAPSGMSTEAMLASMGLGGSVAAEPEPAAPPQPQQTDSVAAFFAAAAGASANGAPPPGFAGGQPPAPAPAPAPKANAREPKKKKERTPAAADDEDGESDVRGGGGGGGGGLNRESVRAAMYKLVSNDNFIDLMVKELKRSM